MKKTVVFLVLLSLLLSAVSLASTASAADLSDNIVLQLTEASHTENEVVINVNLITNTGISGMTLELVYDNTVFEFQDYQKGSALGQLDLMSTDLSSDPTLPVRFNWMLKQNSGVENDFSTGNLLQLRFALKSDSQSGKSEIGFKYDPASDIVYTQSNGGLPTKTKTAAIGKAVVNVETNQITNIEIENAEVSGENAENAEASGKNAENAKTPGKGANVPLIVGISVAAVAVLSTVITVLVVKTRKEKRKKKNWLKL